MPIDLNEGNIGRNVYPGFGKSTYGESETGLMYKTCMYNKQLRVYLIFILQYKVYMQEIMDERVKIMFCCETKRKCIHLIFPLQFRYVTLLSWASILCSLLSYVPGHSISYKTMCAQCRLKSICTSRI